MVGNNFARRQIVVSRLLKFQDGRCAFCHQILLTHVVIDHDHDTGLVRALLCSGCNSLEGRADKEDPEWVAYWTNPPAATIGLVVFYEDI